MMGFRLRSWGKRSVPLLAAAMFCCFSSSASADSMSYTINSPNSAISPYAGPYATVTVDLTSSTTATVTFTSLTPGGNIYLFGGANAVGVNVNASSWTVSGITGTNSGSGFSPGPYSDTGSKNVSDFGTFNQTIKSFDGYASSADKVTFTLTDTGGTWSSAANVLVNNSNGFGVEAHIFVTTSPADASGSAIVTGFGGGAIPEPSSMLLLGGAFAGLGVFGYRRRMGKQLAA